MREGEQKKRVTLDQEIRRPSDLQRQPMKGDLHNEKEPGKEHLGQRECPKIGIVWRKDYRRTRAKQKDQVEPQ